AFSGEMYSTRQRRARSGGCGAVSRLSMAHRKAARVLPDPVGAMTAVCSPLVMLHHALACAWVGAVKVSVNQARVGALNCASTSGPVSPMTSLDRKSTRLTSSHV